MVKQQVDPMDKYSIPKKINKSKPGTFLNDRDEFAYNLD
jgi:hypothetical protein